MPGWLRNLYIGAFSCLISQGAQAETPRVIASIAPIHSLAASIMKDIGEPQLLVEGSASPHAYHLKPSDRKRLQAAQVIFYVGDSYEFFLPKLLQALPAHIKTVNLSQQRGIIPYPVRFGEKEDHEEENHHHRAMDMHFWLDIQNARRIAGIIANTLAERYPEHKPKIMKNLNGTIRQLRALDTVLRKKLPAKSQLSAVVFHDAYQYFEKAYRLPESIAITLHPDQSPSAKRVASLRKEILAGRIGCVFREPQFNSKLVETLAEGSDIYRGVLDPLGATLSSGPDLYPTLMKNLAGEFSRCTAKQK